MMSDRAVHQYVARCSQLEDQLRVKDEALKVAEKLLSESADLLERYEAATRPHLWPFRSEAL